MTDSIAHLILAEQEIAYAVVDTQLRVQRVCGDPKILWSQEQTANVIGRSLLELTPELVGSEDAIQALVAGEIEHLRLEGLNREESQGRQSYVTIALRAIPGMGSEERCLIFLAQDVTAQFSVQQELMQRHNELRLLQERLKHQNEDLLASNAELQLMNEIRSSFISVAAHELRTPLTSIYGFLELLQDTGAENLTFDQQQHLLLMEESTERLLLTLNELLDAARIDSDRLELVLRPVQIREVIEEAIETSESRLLARQQRLELDIPAELPEALCDPERIKQVLGHLLSNASKFTPLKGVIRLVVEPTELGDFLRLAVSDQGQGIANGEEDRLFQRFYRSTSVRRNGTQGAGLGLYITRSLVELHGGEVWYESVTDAGSTFYVTIPVAAPPLHASLTKDPARISSVAAPALPHATLG